MVQMQMKFIEIEKLRPNPFQPREGFSKESIKELADSIKQVGVLQPVIVREHKGGYQIICGERRWRACQFAGEETIPTIIKDTAEQNILVESLIENLHREDLTFTEKENAIYELWETKRYKTKRELAKTIGTGEQVVGSIIEAKEFRENEAIGPEVATTTIVETRGLDKEIRPKLVKKLEREGIGARKVRDYVTTIKKAPKPLAKAIVEDKVNLERAKPIIEHGIPEEKVIETVEELSRRKKEEEMRKKAELEEQKAVLESKLEAVEVERIRSKDQQVLEKIEKIHSIVGLWTVSTVKQIQSEPIRKNAIQMIKDIENICASLLRELGEIDVWMEGELRELKR